MLILLLFTASLHWLLLWLLLDTLASGLNWTDLGLLDSDSGWSGLIWSEIKSDVLRAWSSIATDSVYSLTWPLNNFIRASWMALSFASEGTRSSLTRLECASWTTIFVPRASFLSYLESVSAGFLLPGIWRISKLYPCMLFIHFQTCALTRGWLGR